MPARPLTVIHVLEKTSLSTGSVWQMLEAARGLAARGNHVLVVTRASRELSDRCAAMGVSHLALPLRHELDVLSMRRLARLAREIRPDAVHVHKGIGHAVALGALLLGARFALLVNRGVSFPIGALARLKYRSRRVQRVVAVSESVARVVVAAGVPREKVSVVYGGVDTARFDPVRADPLHIRRELGIPPAAPLVGHVGLRPWKGWKELLQALPLVLAEQPDARLLLIGCASSRERAGVLRVAGEMGIADSVLAMLTRRDMPDVLAACDVVVDPSWAGTGITGTLREAMALARPVVATSVSGNPELVEDGVSGILVPARDLPTLAAAIARLLRDRELATRLGNAARARTLERFSTAVRAARLEALYWEAATEAGVV